MKIRIMEPMTEKEKKKIRACAYARVSTDSRKQEESLENQTESYERLIASNPGYEFAGVYADQGISGFHETRPQFQEMLRRARKGEIDLIITKSISRFARNTITVLKTARELKELGVGIFFEEQQINTLSGDGELMLAVLASFAQEESRSMSENNNWTIKKKFERGEIMVNTERFLGFDKNEFGDLIINPKEALVVDIIYDMALFDLGSTKLKKLLNFLGLKTVTGGEWSESAVNGILINEKYKGDCHLQKYYTPDGRRNQTRLNRGEVQSYYMEGSHPAIVSGEKWGMAQTERERRKRNRRIGAGGTEKYQNRYPLSGLLACPRCGRNLRRRSVYKGKIQWLCSTYIENGKQACKGIRVDDSEVSKQNITKPTVVEEVRTDGKKHYRYTSKEEYVSGRRPEPGHPEASDGGILPGINRPRRTAIKL